MASCVLNISLILEKTFRYLQMVTPSFVMWYKQSGLINDKYFVWRNLSKTKFSATMVDFKFLQLFGFGNVVTKHIHIAWFSNDDLVA